MNLLLAAVAVPPTRQAASGEGWFCAGVTAIVIVIVLCVTAYELAKLWAKVQVAKAGRSPQELDDPDD